MYEIQFKYCDRYTHGRWNTQICVVNSVKECKEIYGLGKDCSYEIIYVREIDNDGKR